MAPGASGTCSFVARVEPEADGGPHHDVVTVHGREIRADGTEGDPVDVLNLSLGYYHEQPGAVEREGALFSVLAELAADGTTGEGAP